MKIYNLSQESISSGYCQRIAALHILAFPDFFLTQLGHKFLKLLYQSYLEDKNSGIVIAESQRGIILGFIAYSKDYSSFFDYLIKKHIIQLAFCSLMVILRHPLFTKKLLSAFKKSTEVKRTEKYVEIASIAVNPKLQGKGIGTKLIQYLKEITDFETYTYISLETDADNNEAANIFYQNNGFELYRTYYANKHRKMNEYHYRGNK